MPPNQIDSLSRSAGSPALPTAITTRPQLASSPAIAVFTSGELAIDMAMRRAEAFDTAPSTTISTSLRAPSPSRAICSDRLASTCCSAFLKPLRRGSRARAIRGVFALPVANIISVSEVEVSPSMVTALKVTVTPSLSSACKAGAAIAAPAVQALLKDGVTDTFNAVTIDGDTSTSDTLMIFATGKANTPRIARARDPRLKGFKKALQQVLANLSEQIARDGEGARKLVEIVVEGAVSKASARRIAMSIANSPLVKTAIAGEDANWGRVVMAVGKAGEPADRDKLSIWFGSIRVAHKGARDPAYDEAEVSAAMKKPEINLKVALGLGKGRDRVLTCDLTKEYIAINGDYRS